MQFYTARRGSAGQQLAFHNGIALVGNIHDEMVLGNERPFGNAIAVERCAALKLGPKLFPAGRPEDLAIHDGMSATLPPVDANVEKLARSYFIVTVQGLLMELRTLVDSK